MVHQLNHLFLKRFFLTHGKSENIFISALIEANINWFLSLQDPFVLWVEGIITLIIFIDIAIRLVAERKVFQIH